MTTIDAPKTGVAGYFQIEAHRRDEEGNEIPGSRRVLAPWFRNLITNSGLDSMISPGFMAYCQVGSGSTPPAVTDTALVARIASAGGGAPAQGTSGAGYSSVTVSYSFAQGAAAGNLSEIGISRGASSGLFSRALILDGSGNPTTITVTSIDYLTVSYQLRVYVDTADRTGSIVVNGTTYSTVTRGCRSGAADIAYLVAQWGVAGSVAGYVHLQTYNGVLGAHTDTTPTGSSGGYTGSMSSAAYTNGNFYVDRTWSFSVSQGNAVGGVTAVSNGGEPESPIQLQTSFSPALPKDNTKTMTITMRMSWGRYP